VRSKAFQILQQSIAIEVASEGLESPPEQESCDRERQKRAHAEFIQVRAPKAIPSAQAREEEEQFTGIDSWQAKVGECPSLNEISGIEEQNDLGE
jgi:hypothetical protein